MMGLPSVLRLGAEMGLLLAVSWPLAVLVRELASRGVGTSARIWLAIAQGLVLASLLLPLAGWALNSDRTSRWAPVQVWSAPEQQGKGLADVTVFGRRSQSSLLPLASSSISRWMPLLAFVAVLGSAFRLLRFAFVLGRLRKHLESLPALRRMGAVRIVAPNGATVPFSVRAGGKAWVAIPLPLLADPASRRFAIAHEIQHHRHRDTSRVVAYETLAALFWWNPAVRHLGRALSAIEELCCDEAVVARRSIDRAGYAACLVEAAQDVHRERFLPAPAASMAAHSQGFLKRRIEMICRTDRVRRNSVVIGVVFVASGVLVSGSLVARGAIADRRVSRAEAEALAVSKSTAIPVKINDRVLGELNRLAATPEAREFVHGGLARMAEYRPSIAEALSDKGLPLDLLAVPLIESGFQNMDSKSKLPSMAPGLRGAGIWMFIPETARHYGLRVDGANDDRLDPVLETRAALSLLAELHDRFGDWPLALAAYNQGSQAVDSAIAAGGTRDHAVLVQAGRLNGYADTVMAAMLLLRNPRLVE